MRKALVVLLAVIIMASMAAWAQEADPALGPHNTNDTFGCQSCHAPHSQVLAGKGLYMWAINVPAGPFTTYGTGTNATNTLTATLTSGTAPVGDTKAAVHTVLCLSCHDSAFNTAMAQDVNSVGGPTKYSTKTQTPVGTHAGALQINGYVNATGSQTDLTANHPVHVLYPNGNAAYTDKEVATRYWKMSSGKLAPPAAFTYGSSVRLFSGTTGYFVECGSCHDPHSWKQGIKESATAPYTTAHFIRGAYANGADATDFCMSCHADKSKAWDGTGLQ